MYCCPSKSVLMWLTVVEASVEEDRLFKELFENRHYNRHSRPVVTLSQTIHVQLGIVLLKIVQVVCTIDCNRTISIDFLLLCSKLSISVPQIHNKSNQWHYRVVARFYRATLYASTVYAVACDVCRSVRLSHAGIVSKRPNSGSRNYNILRLHLTSRRWWCHSNLAEIFGISKLESLDYREALYAWSYL